MKRGLCIKCGHDHVLRVANTADHAEERFPQPQLIARVRIQGVVTSRGLLEAYICRKCGFTELYTQDPWSIPVDGDWVREIVPPSGEGPFR